MNKQQMIDKAIEDLGGDISNVKYGDDRFLWFVDESTCSGIKYYQLLSGCEYHGGQYICTRQEFEDRVKELESMKKWNGEGLPPVGEEIEYTTTKYQSGKPAIEVGEWYFGKIIAYHDEFVWTSDNGIRMLSVTKFRPIQSERDKVVDKACDIVVAHMGYQYEKDGLLVKLMNGLYDAGMLILPK